MKLVNNTYKAFENIINRDAGIIDSFRIIPNSGFIPSQLTISSSQTKNLYSVGCHNDEIVSGGIGFSLKDSIYSTIGEFFERYCSAVTRDSQNYIYGSFEELRTNYSLEHYDSFNLFSDQQASGYIKHFSIVDHTTKLFWSKGVNLIDNSEIYCPSSMVHGFNFEKDCFLPGTTTGLSAGSTLENVIEGGLLECIERNAFSKFWYLQNCIEFIKYRPELILSTYPKNKRLNILFNNQDVEIIIYDLSHLTLTYSYLIIMYFDLEGENYFSTGCSSSFKPEIALEKSVMEAYKCAEELELILIENKNRKITSIEGIKNEISNFKDHYWLYNKYPDLRSKSRVFMESKNDSGFSKAFLAKENGNVVINRTIDEVKKKLNKLYFFDLSVESVKEKGFNVGRILSPELNLLSGVANAPFLKNFNNRKDLFIEFPHFFP